MSNKLMRLRIARNTADEQIVALANAGYALLSSLHQDYEQKIAAGTYAEATDYPLHQGQVNAWGNEVITTLHSIFPTKLEVNKFLHPPHQFGAIVAERPGEYKEKSLRIRLEDLLKGLDHLRTQDLLRYTDLPIALRLYVEDIDSFAKVRDVNPALVADLLDDGALSISEDVVKGALERILDVPFHRKDSPAELDDVYTSNVVVNGARRATAFMLKGPGIKVKEMDIKHCGNKGTQLVRLFDAPADLFIVQFTGRISEMVIKDVDGKAALLRSQGKHVNYLIMDGQDTARILRAYGQA